MPSKFRGLLRHPRMRMPCLAGYSFLRLVEALDFALSPTGRITCRSPTDSEDQAKLARRLSFDSPEKFLLELRRVQTDIRGRFEIITSRERN